MTPFCQKHLFAITEGYENQNLPLDLFLSKYFKAHRSLGSKDRKLIAETLYGIVRWQLLIDYLNGNQKWKARIECCPGFDAEKTLADANIPLHIRLSTPEFLFSSLERCYGKEKAKTICLANNTQAPMTLRVNLAKITREELIKRLDSNLEPVASHRCETAITIKKRINIFSLEEFKHGYFEVQDEGSQIAASQACCSPGMHIFDVCSGSGGKSLAIAPRLEGKGQIYLHDIRVPILQEAKRRMKRAGIQNYQIVFPNTPWINKYKKKMDWVVVDAPCSGTGTLRRNPDLKWKLDKESIQRLVKTQREIVSEARQLMKPGGRLLYITCSILQEENQEQVDFFRENFGLKKVGDPFHSFPEAGGMDGFYAVVLSSSS